MLLYICCCLSDDSPSVLGILLSELRELVSLLLDCSAVFVTELFHHHRLHQAIVVPEDTKLPRSNIQLVDKLAPLLRDL